MLTLTWTGKEDALKAASQVPFRLLEPHSAIIGGFFVSPERYSQERVLQIRANTEFNITNRYASRALSATNRTELVPGMSLTTGEGMIVLPKSQTRRFK